MDQLKLTAAGPGGSRDVSKLLDWAVWAGSVKQCARTLEFGLACPPKGGAEVPLGAALAFSVNGEEIFCGTVIGRGRETGGAEASYTAADRGRFLKRNRASYRFQDITTEGAARRVCADFGIPVGALAPTGYTFTRRFPGQSLYQIIQTGYTLAGQRNGKRYMVRFRGRELEVIEKVTGRGIRTLTPGGDLLTCSVSESVEDAVTRVAILDKEGRQVGVLEDAEAVGLYGVLQELVTKRDGTDAQAEARALLEDGGASQRITATNLGRLDYISGATVFLREPVRDVTGVFWIDSDAHTWKNGVYTNKLVLNYRNTMDEQEAGSE